VIKNLFALTMLSCGIALTAPVFADNDPSMQQIYDTAKAGHMAQAQQMIEQVLRDHPRSAKAHFVAAELDAKQGSLAAARGELSIAEQIDPGLPFAKPESVEALKAELGGGHVRGTALAPVGAVAPVSETHAFPWPAVLLLIAVIAIVWMVLRRRNVAMQYPGQYPGGMPVGAPAGPYGYGGGPGAVPMSGGGIGSSIAGGLASGLAVGAGVVAGEELAHHFLDGDRHEGAGSAPQAPAEPASNADMGGSDFGVNEPDSWDDSSAGSGGGDFGGGGGDDWS
jgi:uncharacterized protein